MSYELGVSLFVMKLLMFGALQELVCVFYEYWFVFVRLLCVMEGGVCG